MIEIANVSISYGEVEVIHAVNFVLSDHKNLVILGPNGCGKTTLIKALIGSISYTGSIRIDGEEVRLMDRKKMATKIAYLGQMLSGDFPFTVYETVLMGRFPHRKKSLFSNETKEDHIKVNEIIERLALKDIKERPITTLSGGQLQRVYLARTLAQEPSYIVLDEPTNHLDVRHQMELLEYLKEWGSEKGHTIIGVFHDLLFASNFADDFLFLKEGKNSTEGSTKITAAILRDTFNFEYVEYFEKSYQNFKQKMRD